MVHPQVQVLVNASCKIGAYLAASIAKDIDIVCVTCICFRKYQYQQLVVHTCSVPPREYSIMWVNGKGCSNHNYICSPTSCEQITVHR